MTYTHPVNPETYDSSDPFGSEEGRVRAHRGSDYRVPAGTVVVAPSDGEVVFAEYYGELGNLAGVAFDDGMFGGLAHNSAFIRSVGDRVSLGEPLSLSGATGKVTGAHSHFSLGSTRGAIFGEGYGSTLVDPYAYVQAHLSGASSATRKERTVLHFYVDDEKAPRGARYVILTQDGRRCDYTSGAADFPNGIAGQIGNAVKTDDALIESLQAQLRKSGPTLGSVTVASDPKLLALVEALGAKIDALPKTIDDFSDARR